MKEQSSSAIKQAKERVPVLQKKFEDFMENIENGIPAEFSGLDFIQRLAICWHVFFEQRELNDKKRRALLVWTADAADCLDLLRMLKNSVCRFPADRMVVEEQMLRFVE